jgi:hypothetical protein
MMVSTELKFSDLVRACVSSSVAEASRPQVYDPNSACLEENGVLCLSGISKYGKYGKCPPGPAEGVHTA